MKDKDYWVQRFSQLEEAQNQLGASALAEIEKQYREAQKQLEGQIARWYQRFADTNNITMAQARQWLSASELQELKWDVQEYIQYGKENAHTGGWVRELENASAKYHISRLEALKIQTRQSLETLFSKQLGTMEGAMPEIYKSGYYHTLFELQKGFGIGWDIAGLDQRHIEKVLSKPWAADGYNFSERIWGNKQKLLAEIHKGLAQNLLLGGSPQKAVDSLAKKMRVSRANAGRLVMTEKAYFHSLAQGEAFRELGVEQYEIVATLDSHTSQICRSLDGRVFPRKEYQAGVTAPPFHVWCRSTTVPHFAEDFGQIGERAARNGETGQTYYIPADMTYTDWKKTFVEGGDKDDLTGYNLLQIETKNDNILYMDITKDWIQTEGSSGIVREQYSYTVDGVLYKVDGRHVHFSPSEHERVVANILSQKYGKQVYLLPQVAFPQGIQVPDYLINGDRFDLKSPTGKGKNLLSSMVSKKKKQAPNFIFDVTNCPLSEEEIERQVYGLFISNHTKFIETVVILKDDQILKVYKKK